MTWSYTPSTGILIASAIISAYVGLMALGRRTTIGVGTMALLMFAISGWAFASGLEASAIGQHKIYWSVIEYLGASSVPALFLIFALKFGQKSRWVRPVYFGLLSLVPIIGFLITATNELQVLIWKGASTYPTLLNIFNYRPGMGGYLVVVYENILILLGIIITFTTWVNLKQPDRYQIGILFIGSFIPFIFGTVSSFIPAFVPGINLKPLSFSLTGLVIAFGMLKFRLFDLAPLARHALIENLDDGILVLDAQNLVVDINPVAQNILSTSTVDSIGQPITKVLKFWPGLAKRLHDNEDKRETEVRWGINPPRYFHLTISPIYGRQKQLAGRLVVLRDITKRHQTEAELAHNIKELGIINHISLSITSGLDMEHVLKTLFDQCSQLVPIDIFYVALFDETNSLIHIPLFYEGGVYQVGPSRDINDRPGTIGTVIKRKRTLYINNINNETALSDTHPNQINAPQTGKTTRSYIGIPLSLRERVIGVLSIQNYRADAYSDEHIRLLERIAIQAAIAIENARLYAEIQRLAIIDELTGIYNYRGLLELGPREVERAHRFNRPLSVLFFDIDNFRKFNNTYNHATGNIIIKAVSERGRSILRAVDVFARFGGDEFVALLPETDIESAEGVARRMVEEIAANKIVTPFGELGVTISIGLTSLSEERPNLSALIDHANNAEHQAKRGKKGIVVVAK